MKWKFCDSLSFLQEHRLKYLGDLLVLQGTTGVVINRIIMISQQIDNIGRRTDHLVFFSDWPESNNISMDTHLLKKKRVCVCDCWWRAYPQYASETNTRLWRGFSCYLLQIFSGFLTRQSLEVLQRHTLNEICKKSFKKYGNALDKDRAKV